MQSLFALTRNAFLTLLAISFMLTLVFLSVRAATDPAWAMHGVPYPLGIFLSVFGMVLLTTVLFSLFIFVMYWGTVACIDILNAVRRRNER